jgi:glycerophosphoryl diester phosphodiesterase
MILAHRGASKAAPENTLAAFTEARRLGADGVELDVHRSADGAIVVHHDPVVAGLGPIASLRAPDLPAHVPLLGAVIDACAGMVVNIELKDLPGEPGYDPTYPLARLVAQLVAACDPAARIVVSSFDLFALDAAVSVEPQLVTGWGTPNGFDQLSAVQTVIQRGHRALHPQHEAVTAELVRHAHECGITIAAWTADEPAEIRRLAGAGVDTIITNVPDIARSALAAHL